MAGESSAADPGSASLASLATKAETTQSAASQGNQGAGAAASQGQAAWHSDLAGDVASKVQRFSSKEELAKAYINLESKIGAYPGDNASPEAKNEFYKKIGRPDSPDGYQLEAAQLPDGIEYAEGSDSRFKKACWEAGLSPAQAKALYKVATQEISDGYREALTDQAKSRDTASAELRKAWGKEYDTNLSLVGRVGARFAPPSLLKRWDDTGIGNDPDHMAFLASIGRAMSEGTLQGGMGPGPGAGNGRVDSAAIERGEAWRLFPNTPQLRPKGR